MSALVDEARSLLGDEASHGMRHALDTMELARRICAAEGGDPSVVRAAALLHDVGRTNIFSDPGHGSRGARIAREILDRLQVPIDRDLVCDVIARHDDPDDGPRCPRELVVVRDADRLELVRIAPGYLDLERLVTDEALRQVPYALSLHYGPSGDGVAETIARARGVLEARRPAGRRPAR